MDANKKEYLRNIEDVIELEEQVNRLSNEEFIEYLTDISWRSVNKYEASQIVALAMHLMVSNYDALEDIKSKGYNQFEYCGSLYEVNNEANFKEQVRDMCDVDCWKDAVNADQTLDSYNDWVEKRVEKWDDYLVVVSPNIEVDEYEFYVVEL